MDIGSEYYDSTEATEHVLRLIVPVFQHEACNHGFLDVARLLLSGGALVDATGPDGVTCLHDAVLNGHLDIVRLLVRSGASLDARYFSSGVRTLRSLLLLEEPRVFEGELLSCNNKA